VPAGPELPADAQLGQLYFGAQAVQEVGAGCMGAVASFEGPLSEVGTQGVGQGLAVMGVGYWVLGIGYWLLAIG
jgi:hypothetical protein